MAVASFSSIMYSATEMVQEWFEEHSNEFMLAWPPKFP